jgi:hypothetical protein
MALGREKFFRLRAPGDLLALRKRWARRQAEGGQGRRQRPFNRNDWKGKGMSLCAECCDEYEALLQALKAMDG